MDFCLSKVVVGSIFNLPNYVPNKKQRKFSKAVDIYDCSKGIATNIYLNSKEPKFSSSDVKEYVKIWSLKSSSYFYIGYCTGTIPPFNFYESKGMFVSAFENKGLKEKNSIDFLYIYAE